MTDLKIDDLNNEKERLVSDRETLLKRLDELQKSTQQIQTQIQAIGGAIQTCDYFIGKIQQPPEEPDTQPEENEKEKKRSCLSEDELIERIANYLLGEKPGV